MNLRNPIPLLCVSLLLPAACSSSASSSAQSESASQPASAPASNPASAAHAAGNTIVDVAVKNGKFTTLVTALKAAGLVDTLAGPGPFTVFAPTDEAFAKLPAGTVESLLADTEQLTAILTYHVVDGKVMAADVMNMTEAPTKNGASLSIDTSSGVQVGNATVIMADVPADNGVIHVIDTVLIPEPDSDSAY